MNSEGFRVGDFWIEWRDEDAISITNTRLGRFAIIHGGDLEGLLSGVVESAHLSMREAVCASSPTGQHIVDTSMESGPNNCFHCERPM